MLFIMKEDSDGFDTVLDLCRDEQRRVLLAVLTEEQRSLTVTDLTKALLRNNHRTPVTEASREVLTQIQLSLHHEDLPKLEAAGVVEYDPERKHVEPTAYLEQLQPYLAAIVDADPDLEEPLEL